ncbi:MAG: glycosyltransferase [Candidatus Magasanikbacteria bacterium]|nr:glycosyltransferase [Candidatus Magasanikbacteria bacterium]
MVQPRFSIIIPLLATEDHIQSVAGEHLAALRQAFPGQFELILALNGCADLAVEQTLPAPSPEHPELFIIKIKQPGWGRAIKAGLAAARGEFIGYTNASYAAVSELIKIMRYALVDPGAVVKGARQVRENRTRQWVSFFYNLENRLFLGTPVWDVNAAPKIFPRRVLEQFTIRSDDSLLDAEVLYYCYRAGVPLIEIPIAWGKRKGGRSHTNWRTALQLSTGIPRFKWRQFWRKD